ncbi:peptide-methionine (R)-S-oxide reductase MsrB [Spirochaeta dissipatitropha]
MKTNNDWKRILDPHTYHITRESGTEAPFSGIYWNHFKEGRYLCACCKTPLFSSQHKFSSSCGWPSFSGELEEAGITQRSDNSFGMKRTELVCSSCEAHLGHIFNDGPPPLGLRYCINSASIVFETDEEQQLP